MIGHEIVVKFCQLGIHQQEVLGTLTSDVDFKSSQSHFWSLDMGSWLGVSFTSLVVVLDPYILRRRRHISIIHMLVPRVRFRKKRA